MGSAGSKTNSSDSESLQFPKYMDKDEEGNMKCIVMVQMQLSREAIHLEQYLQLHHEAIYLFTICE